MCCVLPDSLWALPCLRRFPGQFVDNEAYSGSASNPAVDVYAHDVARVQISGSTVRLRFFF